MPTYSVDSKVFDLFPAFRRGVVIATQLNNQPGETNLGQLIVEASQALLSQAGEPEPERISVWKDAYTKLGVDPNKNTPSIKFLYDQIHKGKPPRSISKLVDIMNLVSLRWMAPCGGDDLLTILPGDLRLGFAQGDETFAPLFKAAAVESPTAGEVIYFTPQTKRVMCRRWTWRNADFSKITPETTDVAINIDIMTPPFSEEDVDTVLREIAGLLERHCGGRTACHTLSPAAPSFEFIAEPAPEHRSKPR
jgi:DNA/RNA-binding domain of Phe-tRNA-synthetase-like protein